MIPLFVPYVNRFDLLDKAIRSTWHSGAEVTVINNSNDYIDCPPASLQYVPIVPLTFAQTQNAMLKMALGKDFNPPSCVWVKHPFYLFMHADAEAGEGTVTKLIEMAQSLTDEGRKWGVIFTSYDALAAFNTQAFVEIGGWDVNFPWYFGDNIVYRKLRLAGYELVESNLPVHHEPSQTLKSDPQLNFINGITFPFYHYFYTQMWGGEPGHEKYLTPFNR